MGYNYRRREYSANAAAITLAPIQGRLCGAKRGGDNNYSPKKGTPDLGGGKKKDPPKSAHLATKLQRRSLNTVSSYQKTL
jgi:hypothetical protein